MKKYFAIGVLILMIITAFSASSTKIFAEHSREQPEIQNNHNDAILNLFVKGLVWLIIQLIYAIPFMLIFAYVIGTAVITGALTAQGLNTAALLTALAGLGTGIIMLIIVGYYCMTHRRQKIPL